MNRIGGGGGDGGEEEEEGDARGGTPQRFIEDEEQMPQGFTNQSEEEVDNETPTNGGFYHSLCWCFFVPIATLVAFIGVVLLIAQIGLTIGLGVYVHKPIAILPYPVPPAYFEEHFGREGRGGDSFHQVRTIFPAVWPAFNSSTKPPKEVPITDWTNCGKGYYCPRNYTCSYQSKQGQEGEGGGEGEGEGEGGGKRERGGGGKRVMVECLFPIPQDPKRPPPVDKTTDVDVCRDLISRQPLLIDDAKEGDPNVPRLIPVHARPILGILSLILAFLGIVAFISLLEDIRSRDDDDDELVDTWIPSLSLNLRRLLRKAAPTTRNSFRLHVLLFGILLVIFLSLLFTSSGYLSIVNIQPRSRQLENMMHSGCFLPSRPIPPHPKEKDKPTPPPTPPVPPKSRQWGQFTPIGTIVTLEGMIIDCWILVTLGGFYVLIVFAATVLTNIGKKVPRNIELGHWLNSGEVEGEEESGEGEEGGDSSTSNSDEESATVPPST
jgi:hypothetical protein